MIVVIADDFTGAAEIAGVAFSYGYKVAVINNFTTIPDVDVLIVATNMRSLNVKSAGLKSKKVTEKLLELQPEMIYKKIDSVLRGNIGVELQSQMKISNKTRALIIPANPFLNRRIKNGIYYIYNQPLMESFFAKDESFKNKSSNVVDILKTETVNNVFTASYDEALPKTGLIIGNTQSQYELKQWVNEIDEGTAIAGGSGFFEEILKSKGSMRRQYNDYKINKEFKSIFITGSNFPLTKKRVIEAKMGGVSVSSMPDKIYFSREVDTHFVDEWVEEIISMYESNNKVVVSVLQNPTADSISSHTIKVLLGQLIKKVTKKIEINEILVEGGSTAQFIAKALSYNTFFPVQEFSLGVTRMKIGEKEGVHLTLKPGSYEWPEPIWNFDKIIK